jgi:hypothetical protein
MWRDTAALRMVKYAFNYLLPQPTGTISVSQARLVLSKSDTGFRGSCFREGQLRMRNQQWLMSL